jgi:hypothetical protein
MNLNHEAHCTAWYEAELEAQATTRQCLRDTEQWSRLRLFTILHRKFEARFMNYILPF